MQVGEGGRESESTRIVGAKAIEYEVGVIESGMKDGENEDQTDFKDRRWDMPSTKGDDIKVGSEPGKTGQVSDPLNILHSANNIGDKQVGHNISRDRTLVEHKGRKGRLKCALINTSASIRNRREEINLLLEKGAIDCLAITESGLCEGQLGPAIGTFRWIGTGKEEYDNKGGGVGFLIRKGVEANLIKDIGSSVLRVWIEIGKERNK